jgi:hypothetical protein
VEFWVPSARGLNSFGISGAHEGTSSMKSRRDIERRRVANVVRIGLERQPEDRQLFSFEAAAESFFCELDHTIATTKVDGVDLAEERERGTEP